MTLRLLRLSKVRSQLERRLLPREMGLQMRTEEQVTDRAAERMRHWESPGRLKLMGPPRRIRQDMYRNGCLESFERPCRARSLTEERDPLLLGEMEDIEFSFSPDRQESRILLLLFWGHTADAQ